MPIPALVSASNVGQAQAANLDSGRFLTASLQGLGKSITESIALRNAQAEANAAAPFLANNYKLGMEKIQAGDVAGGMTDIYSAQSRFASNPILARQFDEVNKGIGMVTQGVFQKAAQDRSYQNQLALQNDQQQYGRVLQGDKQKAVAVANFQKTHADWQRRTQMGISAGPEPTLDQFTVDTQTVSDEPDGQTIVNDNESQLDEEGNPIEGQLPTRVSEGDGGGQEASLTDDATGVITAPSSPASASRPPSNANTPVAQSNAPQAEVTQQMTLGTTPQQMGDLSTAKAKPMPPIAVDAIAEIKKNVPGAIIIGGTPDSVAVTGGPVYIEPSKGGKQWSTMTDGARGMSITYKNEPFDPSKIPELKDAPIGVEALRQHPEVFDALTNSGGIVNNALIFKRSEGQNGLKNDEGEYIVMVKGDDTNSTGGKIVTKRSSSGIETPVTISAAELEGGLRKKYEDYKTLEEKMSGPDGIVFEGGRVRIKPTPSKNDYDNTAGKIPFEALDGQAATDEFEKAFKASKYPDREGFRLMVWDAFDKAVKEKGMDDAAMNDVGQRRTFVKDVYGEFLSQEVQERKDKASKAELEKLQKSTGEGYETWGGKKNIPTSDPKKEVAPGSLPGDLQSKIDAEVEQRKNAPTARSATMERNLANQAADKTLRDAKTEISRKRTELDDQKKRGLLSQELYAQAIKALKDQEKALPKQKIAPQGRGSNK